MKLAHTFFDVDMRCSHEGLKKIVDDEEIEIKSGDFIIFLNSRRTILKMFCGSLEVILMYKKGDQPIDPGVIPLLPQYVGGGKIEMNKAMHKYLTQRLARKGITAKEG